MAAVLILLTGIFVGLTLLVFAIFKLSILHKRQDHKLKLKSILSNAYK